MKKENTKKDSYLILKRKKRQLIFLSCLGPETKDKEKCQYFKNLYMIMIAKRRKKAKGNFPAHTITEILLKSRINLLILIQKNK